MFFDNEYQKLYETFEELSKVDLNVGQALKAAKKASPEAAKVLARHIYLDQLTGNVGNAFAYKDFLSRNQNNGVHVSLDANGFGAINKEHGFEKGNEAIKHLFGAVSEASRQVHGKAFRPGGDEGRLHFSTQEKAEGFVKLLKEKLNALPHVPGTNHKLSVSVGLGYSPEHAEKALTLAKDQLGPLVNGKRQKINLPGSEPTVHHSLLHESPPENWRPAVGKVTPPHEVHVTVPDQGLKLHNPLAPKKS